MLTIYLIGLVITFLLCAWAESESINFILNPMDGAVLVIFTSIIWPIAVLIVSVETLIGYIKKKEGKIMPIYTYKDKKTDVHVEVIRDFKDWDRLPEGKEIPESLAGTEPDWERVIGNVSVVKGHGWGAGKGSW